MSGEAQTADGDGEGQGHGPPGGIQHRRGGQVAVQRVVGQGLASAEALSMTRRSHVDDVFIRQCPYARRGRRGRAGKCPPIGGHRRAGGYGVGLPVISSTPARSQLGGSADPVHRILKGQGHDPPVESNSASVGRPPPSCIVNVGSGGASMASLKVITTE